MTNTSEPNGNDSAHTMQEDPFILGLRKAIEIRGVTQREFADGITSEVNLSRVLKGKTGTSATMREMMAEKLNLEVDEIIALGTNSLNDSSPHLPDEFSLVPKYGAKLSAGNGSLEVSDQVESQFAFRKDWLSRKPSNKLALFEVVGDSMYPFICENDVVLVDLSHTDPEMIVDGKTYAIREDHNIKIKRLTREGGKLIIRSQDRESYPDYTPGEDFTLLGRVIWVGHEVK